MLTRTLLKAPDSSRDLAYHENGPAARGRCALFRCEDMGVVA